mgnify:CR=1 FL=1
MLYLAKICRQGKTDNRFLHLLAQQKSEHFWSLLMQDDALIEAPELSSVGDGVLVLVELSSQKEVISIEDASGWVLELVEKYLTMGISPDVLHQEAERIEAWRQELTLQNQDVARRALEIETRRDQIQELEKKLELERKNIELVKEQDDDRPEDSQSANGADESPVRTTPS